MIGILLGLVTDLVRQSGRNLLHGPVSLSGKRSAQRLSRNHLLPTLVVMAMYALRPHGRAGAYDKTPGTTFASGADARQRPYTTGLLTSADAGQAVTDADWTQASSPSCLIWR
jgi:hypothetical protein